VTPDFHPLRNRTGGLFFAVRASSDPAASREYGTDLHAISAPRLGAFDHGDARFWILIPYETRRICCGEAEGGCWANVGEPAKLAEIPMQIFRTRGKVETYEPLKEARCEALNDALGLRDFNTVIAT
jgi:hypothetical protein